MTTDKIPSKEARMIISSIQWALRCFTGAMLLVMGAMAYWNASLAWVVAVGFASITMALGTIMILIAAMQLTVSEGARWDAEEEAKRERRVS
jgi:hypothetical protein